MIVKEQQKVALNNKNAQYGQINKTYIVGEIKNRNFWGFL